MEKSPRVHGAQVCKMGYLLVYIHLRQSLEISGGNVDEEDSGYLKMGECI